MLLFSFDSIPAAQICYIHVYMQFNVFRAEIYLQDIHFCKMHCEEMQITEVVLGNYKHIAL